MRIIYFLFFVFTVIANGQQVKVLDRGSNFPIQGVTIYNDTNSNVVYTNKNGIADLSEFKDFDVISFNHLSYYEFEILKRELGVIEYVIYLNKRAEQLEEIVLSASKGEERRSRVAVHLTIASLEEIKKIAPQTSADLLANLPGIRVQ